MQLYTPLAMVPPFVSRLSQIRQRISQKRVYNGCNVSPHTNRKETPMHRYIAAFALLLIVVQATPLPAVAQDAPGTVPPKPVYLAVGDSLTVGLYAAENRGFAYMVADALPGYALEIAAVTGDGIDNTLKQLPVELADHTPELVTVEVGINNLQTTSAPVFAARYITLLQMLQDTGIKTVVACTVPWTGQSAEWGTYARALEFNDAIVRAAQAYGYTPADCWGATVGHYEYLSERDGFHPNSAGHRAIAGAVLTALRVPHPVHYLPDVRR
ncbi:MAG: SGNH/GDSL hydrolase family protein [Desulfurellales bacterium]|nr:MAG: SGNH/GDSL hydrolase family protein [Desulfurellales bacterium]